MSFVPSSSPWRISRRKFLAGAGAIAAATTEARRSVANDKAVARIAITLDLEMSRHYPKWDDMHWDYEKGNLDEATKRYAVECARRVKRHGGRIHFFALGRTMEQANVDWLREIASEGHPIGNHTYDHVNVKALRPDDIQFRFRRSPWLVGDREPAEVIAENIRLSQLALSERACIKVAGFRTPGGFQDGLADRPDVQQMLLDQGYTWVSSKYPAHPNTKPGETVNEAILNGIVAAQAAAQPSIYPSGLVEIPMSPISDVTALRSARWKLNDFLTAIECSVRWAIENRMVYDFLAHPSCLVVTDPSFQAVDRICRLVDDSRGQARLVTLSSIAESLQCTMPRSKDA